jgi:hypothetical protein
MTFDSTRLADRAEIADLVARYSWGVDLRDWDLFRSIWAEDAEWVYKGKTLRGPDDIVAASAESSLQRTYNHHLANDILIEFTSENTANGRVHGQGVGGIHDGTEFHTWVRYNDEYVRRNGSWSIARRELEMFPPSPVM